MAKKTKKTQKTKKTSDKTFDRREATAKAAPARTTAKAIAKSTRNKIESGKIKETGVNVFELTGGDPITFVEGGDVKYLNNQEGRRVFDRTAGYFRSYYGDGESIYGDVEVASGTQIVPRWSDWDYRNDPYGPRVVGETVARDPYYATPRQWLGLREYFQEERVEDRKREVENRKDRKLGDHLRKTKRR